MMLEMTSSMMMIMMMYADADDVCVVDNHEIG